MKGNYGNLSALGRIRLSDLSLETFCAPAYPNEAGFGTLSAPPDFRRHIISAELGTKTPARVCKGFETGLRRLSLRAGAV